MPHHQHMVRCTQCKGKSSYQRQKRHHG
jgi:stalled ribosome alternative rescue factor ArfA